MIHILVGHDAAKNLEAAFALDENLRGEIVVLRDTLGIGEILTSPELPHDELRTACWQTIVPGFAERLNEEETVKQLIEKARTDEEPVCFWLSPCVSDVCAYYWLLNYFKPFPDLLHTINIIGLPFLNEKGQLFYPVNFSQVPPKEFTKTKRLLKEVTPAEYELEGEEWRRLQGENAWVRTYEGGKKIVSRDIQYFDSLIKSSLGNETLKANKVVNDTLKKMTQTVSHMFIEYRLRQLITQGIFIAKGNPEGALKDVELSLPTLDASSLSTTTEAIE